MDSLALYASVANYLVPIVELVFAISVIGIVFVKSSRATMHPSSFDKIESFFSRLARRKNLSVLSCGLAVIFLRCAILPIVPIPQPSWQDEFSFLLASDTFAHGRLTNPTHPMWIHFESFHILQQPTYQSMYPPGQGMILALGQWLGHPWFGQLLATALACAAICWMLQAWLPPGWALFGGLLSVLRIGIMSYWVNGYFCGSLPAFAGALVLGALPRLERRASTRDAVILVFGAALLANTRPYEGFVFCLPVAIAVVAWLFRDRRFSTARLYRHVIVPVCLVLAVAALATSFYFWRVTGDPFQMPYQVNRQTYAIAPYFIWQSPRSWPAYHHPIMQKFYVGFELNDFESGRSVLGFLRRTGHKIFVLWMFYLGPALTIPLIALPWTLGDRRMRVPVILAAVFLVGLAIEVWTGSHYASPATGLLYLFLVQSMRHLRRWRWHDKPLGAALVRAIPAIAVAMLMTRIIAIAAGASIEPTWSQGNRARVEVAKTLAQMPGKNLVIVRYTPEHGTHFEWVYNAADIDGSKTVWARDMGPSANQELVNYFRDRQVWIVDADERTPAVKPYSESMP